MSSPSIDTNEEAEIRNNLSPLIEEAKTKKMAAQQLAIDATKLLSVTADRFNESKDQGFFKRCWSKINGKQGESLRANQGDLIEMQKYAWCYLMSLQDQNLILAESVAVIRNDLSKLALMETQLANAETETRQAIAELVIRFSKRIENVERDAKTSKWLLAVEVRKYENYHETFRMLKIVSDYFLFFKENNIKFEASLASSPSQPSDLEIAFQKARIDYGKTIKLGDFIQNILSEIMKCSLGEYNKIVSIKNGENILDANFVLDNISSSAYVALYHVSEHYQIVDNFARRAKSEGDLQFYAETLKDFMPNGEINLDYEYSIIDLAKEILAGHFLAVDIYNEQHGIVVEYDSIDEASSDASISSMLATYNKVDYHYLAETECSIEDRKNYIESFSALGLSNSEEQHHYILALSSLFQIPENDSYFTETPANKLKRIMPSIIKLLNSQERKLAWVMDAVFIATRDGVIDPEEIKTIHGVCRGLNMLIGDIDSFIDNAKTIAVSTSRDEVSQAISAIKGKTDSWRTVIDYKKVFSFDEVQQENYFKKAVEKAAVAVTQFDLESGNYYAKVGDNVEAVKWYRKAAEQGNATAQNNLGVCYENGDGVAKDMKEAVKWYQKAAEQGNADAQLNLEPFYRSGADEDKAEAFKWLLKTTMQGHAVGTLNLGKCCYGWCSGEAGKSLTSLF